MTAFLSLNKYNKNLFDVKKEKKLIKNNYATNCILSTPQRIKYTLDTDGSFILKAGSKVFIDGNEYTITQDSVSNLGSNTTNDLYVIYRKQYKDIITAYVQTSLSGTSLPETGINGQIFYNLAEKKIYKYTNSSWSLGGGLSLPVAKIRLAEAEKVQTVYNYYDLYSVCGNTLIVFPRTKVLMPNGLNSDGTLKNLEISTIYSSANFADGIDRYAFIDSNGKVGGLGIARFAVCSLSEIENLEDVVTRCYVPELNICFMRPNAQSEWRKDVPYSLIMQFADNYTYITETNAFGVLNIANKNEIVDLFNVQKIYGLKTFKNPIILDQNSINTWTGIHGHNNDFDLSNYSNANVVTGCRLLSLDKNKEFFSAFQGYKAANNTQIKSQMIARTFLNGDKTKSITSSIEVGINKEGTRYTYCPSSNANNSILTTVQIVETDSGVGIKLGNGLIIQWGTSEPFTGRNQNQWITLPIPFSANNSYRVVPSLQALNSANLDIDDNFIVGSNSTTGFNLWSTTVGHNDGVWSIAAAWIAIGR